MRFNHWRYLPTYIPTYLPSSVREKWTWSDVCACPALNATSVASKQRSFSSCDNTRAHTTFTHNAIWASNANNNNKRSKCAYYMLLSISLSLSLLPTTYHSYPHTRPLWNAKSIGRFNNPCAPRCCCCLPMWIGRWERERKTIIRLSVNSIKFVSGFSGLLRETYEVPTYMATEEPASFLASLPALPILTK